MSSCHLLGNDAVWLLRQKSTFQAERHMLALPTSANHPRDHATMGRSQSGAALPTSVPPLLASKHAACVPLKGGFAMEEGPTAKLPICAFSL